MPNGGSDCCGTCWFNARNRGEAGYGNAQAEETSFCTIRNLAVSNPFYTYCGNHPHRRPDRDPIPIGPVFVGEGRRIWKRSPDSEEVRAHLLELATSIHETPKPEYPAGAYLDELVVWQLGEFKEVRALETLERIIQFDPDATEAQTGRSRAGLIRVAKKARNRLKRSDA